MVDDNPEPPSGGAGAGGPAPETGRPALASVLLDGMVFALKAAGGVALFVAALYLLDIGCVIRATTGVPCPGCGMTRAWLAALRGDLPAAFAYHPLFWAVPVAFALAWAERLPQIRGRVVVHRALTVVAMVLVAALVVVWAVRLACPDDAGLLFGGRAPAGVEPDIIHLERPLWLRLLARAGLIG